MLKLLLLSILVAFAYSEDCFDHGIDYIGNDLDDGHYVSTGSAEACQIN